ncbi:MAG TPA: hypothetical protein VJ111_08290 [Chitinophagaceae bacterium]|nr:hypothetical protein [Chitinophagaceae bacterium]
MKNSFFLYIIFILIISCNQNEKTSAGKKDSSSVIDSNTLGIPVTNLDLTDDSVFADGSKPGAWDVAGITRVHALKIFIKDLQYIVANDNREEISKLIRYPLNSTIKTQSDFLANYNKIITPKIKDALAKANLRQLFRNYKGVMIGNGEIWIAQEGKDFKIIAINN